MRRELEYRNSETAVIDAVESLLAHRLDQAAARFAQQVVENISRPVQEGSRSTAGDYPCRDSGALAGSIAVIAPEQLTRQVLTDAEQGLLLELGTPAMAPRPYLTRTLDEISIELGALFTEGGDEQ
ncbi:MAG: hypothetical protein AB7O26_02740 [Planctomycetaceae bacterium]